MRHTFFYTFVIVLLSFLTVLAQIPKTISYQGMITDKDGNPLNGDQALTLRLYNVENNGEPLWEEVHEVAVSNGIFNIILGNETPLELPFDGPYWLSITIGTGMELQPRTPLTSSAYSLNTPNTYWTMSNDKDLSWPGDIHIGGSVNDFDDAAEYMAIRGKSKEWFVGVENKEDDFGVDSGFFISQAENSDGTLHIFENGMVLLSRLHIKQQSATGLILQNAQLGRGWLLGTRTDGKLTFAEGTFSDAGSSTNITRLGITQDGKVGIGHFSIDDPTHELHLIHASTGGGGATAGLKIENEGSNNNWWALYTANGSAQLELYYKGTIKGKFIASDGSYEKGSDRQLKRDIQSMPSVLDKVLQLNPSTFYFKDVLNPSDRSMGFIAQEVQPLFPELVGYAGEEQHIMTLNYDGFGVIAIKAMQEQQQTIDNLLQRIEELEKAIKESQE
jgi:hypothetical protein